MSITRESGNPEVIDAGWDIQRRMLRRVEISPDEVKVYTDAGGVYAVFGDRQAGVLSSSLRAVLTSGRRRYAVNRDALCEQLITGAVAGRETLFKGIEKLDGFGPCDVRGTRCNFIHFPFDVATYPTSFRSDAACVGFQLEILRDYFRELNILVSHREVSTGLSGGYDSRLLLALALDADLPINPFTYESPSHEAEMTVADRLAAYANRKVRRVPVRSQDAIDNDDLEANANDALIFFDGRTNKTMGTFGDVHTSRVHRQCVGPAAANMNGLGGEMFRNRERLPSYSFSFSDWFWHFIAGPAAFAFFKSSSERNAFERRMARKYSDLLALVKLKRMDRTIARRWYREVWLPDFAGPRLSAENRVAPAVMPFADARVSAAALRATPFIGPHGAFEAALIRRIDPRLADLPSSYGHGFGAPSRLARFRDVLLAHVPPGVRLRRHRLLEFKSRRNMHNSCAQRSYFAGSLGLLKSLELPLIIETMLNHEDERNRILYLAGFLFRHRNFIEF